MHVNNFVDYYQHYSGGCNSFDPDNVVKPFIGI